MAQRLRGSKSSGKGGSSSAVAASEDPNTLRSAAVVRLLEVLGEGEIKGLVNGARSIYFDDTVLQNQDGSYNFKGVTFDVRYGLPDQPYIQDFPTAETSQQVGVQVKKALPITRTLNDGSFTIGRATIRIPALAYQDTASNALRGTAVQFRIETRYVGGPWVNPFGDDLTIAGKTTSPYDRSYSFRLPVGPAGQGAPWDVRATRITDDPANASTQSDTYFGTLTGVVEAKFSYPYTAMIGLCVEAEQFGSDVPVRAYEVFGRIIQVPDNYDPETRVYTGIWGGNFKWAWTDNPAWVLYDILTNARFGLGRYLDVTAVDKWGLYQIAAYCDQLVPDGYGGMEPRMTFNGAFTEQKDAYEVLSVLASAFRGMVYWSAGAVMASQDRPVTVPDIVVSRANVINGRFTYQSTGKTARSTSVIVKFRDRAAGYKEAFEVCEDQAGIARYGLREKTVDATGCTSRGQARRLGRWILFTELYEKQIVTYRAGLDHSHIRPGDVAAVHDPSVAGLSLDDSLAGRCLGGTTANRVLLDRPVTLLANTAYTLLAVLPSGKVEERAVTTTGPGSVTALQLSGAGFSEAPAPESMWALTYPSLKPQLYKVVTIREIEPHIYEVQGLQSEPSKHAYVDVDAKFDPLPVNDASLGVILPPINLKAVDNPRTINGQPRSAILLSWSAPPQAFVATGYFVSARLPSGDVVNYGLVKSTSFDIMDTLPGEHVFFVATAGINNKASQAAQLTFVSGGWEGVAGPRAMNLRLPTGGNVFGGRSCTFLWDTLWPEGVPPYATSFMVRVFTPDGGTLLYTEKVAANTWTFDYEVNRNTGGPRRAFQVRVTALDLFGRETTAAILSVSNPAPVEISPTLRANSETLFVSFPAVTDLDFAGYLVWVSETPNLNPLTLPPFEVTGSFFTYAGKVGQTLYVRAAAFDAFGKDPATLNIGPEQSQVLTLQLFDPLPPPIPGQPTVSGNVTEVAPDGTVTAKITLTWGAVSSTNLGTYEVAIAEGNNPADSAYAGGRFVSGLSTAFAGLMPGRVYSFKIRSNPKNGFADSGWSPVRVVTAAANTTAPANPTAFTVKASFEGAQLSWTNPTTADLALVEVWGFDGSSVAATPPSGAVRLATVGKGTTSYPDSLGTIATRTYWLRAVNTSGTVAAGYVRGGPVTTGQLTAQQIQAGVAESLLTANQIALIKTVPALPATKTYDYVAFQGKTYRWDADTGKYTAEVAAGDIAGKIAAAQIDTVSAASIQAALAASQIATSQLTGNFDGSRITGELTAARLELSRIIGTVGGQLTSAQIAGLDAAKLTTKITTTQITDGAITTPLLGASAVQAGNVAAGAITASKLSIGSVAANLCLGGDMEEVANGVPVGWTPLASQVTAGSTVTAYTGAVHAGATALLLSKATNDANSQVAAISARMPIEALATYECLSYVAAVSSTGTTVGFSVTAYFYDKNDGYLTAVALSANGPVALGGFSRRAYQVQAPAGSAYARIAFWNQTNSTAQYVVVDAVVFRRAGGVTSIEDGAIVADKLAANSVITSKLAANSVTASKMVLVDSQNLNLNPSFQQGYEDWLRSTPDVAIVGLSNASTGDLPAGAPALNAMRLTRTTSQHYVQNITDPGGGLPRGTPCSAGDLFYLEALVYSSVAATVGLQVVGYTAANVLTGGNVVGVSIPAGVWTKVSGTLSIPAGMIGANCRIYNNTNNSTLWVTNVRFQRKNGAELIVDGTISARKLMIGATAVNLVPSGEFLDRLEGWNRTETAQYQIGTGDGPTGGNYLRLNRGVTDNTVSINIAASDIVPVEGGTPYEASFYLRGPVAAASQTGLRYRILWYDGNKAALPGTSAGAGTGGTTNLASYTDVWSNDQAVSTSWVYLSKQITPPAAARFCIAQFYHHNDSTLAVIEIANVALRKAVTATTIADGAITTGKLTAFAVDASKIAAGAIVASKLAIASANMAFNADVSQGALGYTLGFNGTGLPVTGPDVRVGPTFYAPTGFASLQMRVPTATASTTSSVQFHSQQALPTGVLANYGVTGGTTYEVSACLSMHRAAGLVGIAWYTAAGAYISEAAGSVVPSNGANGGLYATFPKSTLIAVAPANAASAVLIFRMQGFSGADAYLFASAIMFAATRAGATETSPYVAPGITTIDGGTIVTNSIVARHILAGQIKADHLDATTVFAKQAVIDNLRGALASFGQLGADTIQAGAIGADKIAAGLNTGNLLANSDVLGGIGNFPIISNTGWGSVTPFLDTTWNPAGMQSVGAGGVGSPAGNLYVDIAYQRMLANGTYDTLIPVTGGERYEFSVYTNNHRCTTTLAAWWFDKDRNIINSSGGFAGSGTVTARAVGGGETLSNYNRNWGFLQMPANAAYLRIAVRAFGTANANPVLFATGWLLAKALPSQTQPSAWAPQSTTVIDGGTIATGTVLAKHIRAQEITSDHISATNKILAGKVQIDGVNGVIAAINVNAEKIQARSITVGNGDLNSLIAGSNTTKINGGALQANSVEARHLTINNRGITAVNINFEMERVVNANGVIGAATRVLKWTGGQIEWVDDNGFRAFSGVGPGRVSMGTSGSDNGWATVWFDKSAPGMLWSHPGNNIPAVLQNPNCVLVATTNDLTGVTVNYGGTIIDGDKIVTNSIQARNIAADAIQARHVAAGQITGDHITGTTIEGRHIKGTTIEGRHIVSDTIEARMLKAGIIGADQLAVGVNNGNMLTNSDFAAGATNLGQFYLGGGNVNRFYFGHYPTGTPWGPCRSLPCVQLVAEGYPSGAHNVYFNNWDIGGGQTATFPVQGGQRYEFSCYINCYRSLNTQVGFVWLDINKQYLGEVYGNALTPANAVYDGNFGPGTRSGVIQRAPGNAYYCQLVIRTNYDGSQQNPDVYFTGAYFSRASEYQTALSPWSPGGVTVIDGGAIRARSIRVDRLDAGSLSAISADLGTVTAGVARSADGRFVIDFNAKYLAIWD